MMAFGVRNEGNKYTRHYWEQEFTPGVKQDDD